MYFSQVARELLIHPCSRIDEDDESSLLLCSEKNPSSILNWHFLRCSYEGMLSCAQICSHFDLFVDEVDDPSVQQSLAGEMHSVDVRSESLTAWTVTRIRRYGAWGPVPCGRPVAEVLWDL